MGIKLFYSWLRNNYKDIFYDSSYLLRLLNGRNIILYFDLNCFIYDAIYYKYQKGIFSSRLILPTKYQQDFKNDIEEIVFYMIQFLKEYLYLFVKTETIYFLQSIFISIDGIAPKSKQIQQKQRRYKSKLENDLDFDLNNITCGTKFIETLECELLKNIHALKTLDSEEYNFNIEVSTSKNKGEGEHKIIEKIYNYQLLNTNNEHIVVSKDSDLVLLSALLNRPTYIMSKLKEMVDVKIFVNNLNINIKDFVILTFFLGNDFLPPFPSIDFHDKPDGLTFLCSFLKNNDKNKSYLTKDKFLNINNIYNIFYNIYLYEKEIFKKRNLDKSRRINKLWKEVKKCTDKDIVETYYHFYYTKHFDGYNKKDIIVEYIRTIHWNWLYYNKKYKFSWTWFFPYNYILHAKDFVTDFPRDVIYYKQKDFKNVELDVNEQLLYILPYNSLININEELSNLKKNEKDYTINFDMNWKKYPWEYLYFIEYK
jgi:5'-3' exonuclease